MGASEGAMRYRFEDFVLDADLFELRRGEEPIPLQPKPLLLLLHLLQNRERTVGKRELLDALWPDVVVHEGSLTRAVNVLRRALGETQQDGRVIRTVHSRGYRVAVPVAEEGAAGEAAVEARRPLYGRERELEAALAGLALALGGAGALLLVLGETGIGKTRLAEELGRVAAGRGASVFWGRSVAGDAVPALWPWAQVVRACLDDREPLRALARLGGAASELAELVPEVRDHLPELPLAARGDAEGRFRLLDAIVRLLRVSAEERPLVVVLDDLHRADPASRALAELAATELARSRVLLVATWNEEEAGAASVHGAGPAELVRAAREPRTLRLEPLSAEQVGAWLARASRVALPDPVRAEIQRRSEGNPLFVRELVQWLEAQPAERLLRAEIEIPDGVRQLVARRMAALSGRCRDVLAAAAVLGRELRLVALVRSLGVSAAELLAPLAEAERARVIAAAPDAPGTFRFSHPLLRDAIYERLGASERAGLHLRAGLALEQLYTPRALAPTRTPLPIQAEHLAELAHHFGEAALAGEVGKGLDYTARAGDAAAAQGDAAEAARHWRRALALLAAFAPEPSAARAELRERLERALAAQDRETVSSW
jgi:predicted ATPase